MQPITARAGFVAGAQTLPPFVRQTAMRAAEIVIWSLLVYDRAVDALGHEGITDVICLMGFYTSVSMTLAFYDVPAGATGMPR